MTNKDSHRDEALPQQEQENVLISLLLNIIVPTLVLSKLSDADRLGPVWALIVAVVIPAGYGIWFAVSRRQANIYSILGVISVLLTGVLGLLQTDALWIAAKEAVMPLLIGAVVLLSHLRPTPFVASILLNPQVVDRAKISAALDANDNNERFRSLLWKSSLALGATLIFSAVANFFVAQYCLDGKEPGSEEFTKALGTIVWAGYLVIGLPMMAAMIVLMFKFMNQVSKLTGLTMEEFMINAKAKAAAEKEEPLDEAGEESETDRT